MARGEVRDALLILLLLALASATAWWGMTQETPRSGGDLVLTSFPGIDGDVRILLKGCPVRVEPIAPPGSDPHEYSLRPGDAARIRSAKLIILTGHAPFEREVVEIAQAKTIIITRVPGIRLYRLPSGAINLHMPIYDPHNYLLFARYTEKKLEEAFPGCAPTLRKNLEAVEAKVRAALKAEGALRGAPAAASSPLAQYAASWLGLDIRVYLVQEHGAGPSPASLEEASKILQEGGIAVIVVDSAGRPLSQADRLLEEKASALGAPILRVEAPFTPRPVLYKIQGVAGQALALAGRISATARP